MSDGVSLVACLRQTDSGAEKKADIEIYCHRSREVRGLQRAYESHETSTLSELVPCVKSLKTTSKGGSRRREKIIKPCDDGPSLSLPRLPLTPLLPVALAVVWVVVVNQK